MLEFCKSYKVMTSLQSAFIHSKMMSFIQVSIIILAIISFTRSEDGEPSTTPDTIISELSSIFEIEKNDETLLEDKKNVVCDTKECHIIAKELIRGMNISISPCDNFYDFVCGAWETENRIPDYEASWSRFDIYQDTVNRRIKSVLETEPLSTDILPVRQAKKWYRSCLDVGTLEERGIHPMEAVLIQVGGWPMALDPEEWDEKEHSWQSVEHDYFHITGDHVFYGVSAIHWGDWFAILLSKGSVPLHEKFPEKYRNYTGGDDDSYTQLITVVAQMFADYNKASITNEMIVKDVQDLVAFEKELHLMVDDDQGRDSNWTLGGFVEWYNANVTDSDTDNEIQKIDFAHLIRRKFDLVNREIEDSDILYAESYDYYVQLTKLLDRTATRTIVNYIHWYFISDMLAYTTEAMRNALFVFLQNEFDLKQRKPRWLECIDEMKMTTAAAYAFVQKYFSQEVEDAAKEMIAIVREEMAKQIDSSNWMDDETKTIAKDKLNAMHIYIGFPDWYKNETSVLNSYKGLAIGYDHFDNILNFKKYETKKMLRGHDRILGRSDMAFNMMDPTVYNAFYDRWDNYVVLPAANFQAPLFTSRVPPSVNYGSVGLTIGHEIGHGFDGDAIKFELKGNETDISEKMQEMYDERAECFVEQFNKYFGVTEDPDSDKMSRGRFTRPDNVADSTGLQSVFKALKKLIETHSVENYKLPGFENYTDEQMFYIAFAGEWCGVMTPKFKEKMEADDEHSPGRWRVIGSVSNTKDFAEAFNCPVGSPMNPEKKCNIWQSSLDNVASKKLE